MSRLSLTLLCSALLGLAPGCAKRSPASTAASYPESYSGSGGADMAEAPPAPSPSYGGESEKKAMADYDESNDDYRSEPTTMAAAPARPAGGATPPDRLPEPKAKPTEVRDGEQKPEDSDPKKQFARQIIYTAELQLSVYKLEDAMQRAEALTLAAGGYVQNMSQGYYVLRIPAPALRGIMDELAHLGVVEARTLQARDVSEEYVDLTTRIRVLRETQAQLLVLLKQARNVDEALKVRESVDRITMELEQAMGRLRMLESLIGFSTLTVRMSQRGPQNTIPSSNDPFPWVDGLGVEATEWN